MGAQLRYAQFADECAQSDSGPASLRRIGEPGEVGGGQLRLAECEVAAFRQEPAQPAQGCALG